MRRSWKRFLLGMSFAMMALSCINPDDSIDSLDQEIIGPERPNASGVPVDVLEIVVADSFSIQPALLIPQGIYQSASNSNGGRDWRINLSVSYISGGAPVVQTSTVFVADLSGELLGNGRVEVEPVIVFATPPDGTQTIRPEHIHAGIIGPERVSTCNHGECLP